MLSVTYEIPNVYKEWLKTSISNISGTRSFQVEHQQYGLSLKDYLEKPFPHLRWQVSNSPSSSGLEAISQPYPN